MSRFITHSGTFHADEVFATAILRKALGMAHEIVRTKDASIALPGDIVYDIGFGELDHHQDEKVVRPNGIPYAACGLVWRKYGMSLCISPEAFASVDACLVQGIDAADSGVKLAGDERCRPMAVSSVVAAFNPRWDDPRNGDPAYSDACFMRAVEMADAILGNTIDEANATFLAKDTVEKAIDAAKDGIMELDRYCPWDRHLLLSANPKAADLLYVVFPSNRGGWNWQAVPAALGSFDQRNYCPKAWRGRRDADVKAASGVPGAVFCHPSGFLGACETYEDAMAMAAKAIAEGSRTKD